MGFKQLGLGKHLQLTDVSGRQEFYSSERFSHSSSYSILASLVKHILNPLGLAKYEIRQNDQVIADVR